MQAAGTKRQKRRDHRGIAGKRPVRSEIIEGADFECPVQLYNTLPMYEDIDLEHIKEITKQRQRALNIIDSVYADSEDQEAIKGKLDQKFRSEKNVRLLGIESPTPTEEERKNDAISHWMLKLAFCKIPDLKQWFVRNEVNLFRFRFNRLTSKAKFKFFELSKFNLESINKSEISGDLETYLNDCGGGISSNASGKTWYRIPWQQVLRLMTTRKCYVFDRKAYVPEEDLIEFVVGKFRSECNRWLAGLAKKFDVMMENEQERLVPILKSFGNTISDADFSSAEGRLTFNSIDMLRKTSMPPCIRQLLDALHADNKLKHDGRVHLWAFFKAAGMPLEDALKFTFTRMTAYANPEKEFKYNVRHVYGKEGGGKGVGAYGCSTKIKALPVEGQYQGCPFKHQRNLKQQLRNWGVNENDIDKIKKKADDGHYQVACNQFFRSTHKDKDEKIDLITILHPNNFFDQSFDWNTGEHKLLKADVAVKTEDMDSSSYAIDWETTVPLSQKEKESQSQKEFERDDFLMEE